MDSHFSISSRWASSSVSTRTSTPRQPGNARVATSTLSTVSLASATDSGLILRSSSAVTVAMKTPHWLNDVPGARSRVHSCDVPSNLHPRNPTPVPAESLSIGQAAEVCGLTIDTRRYWERAGLTLWPTPRTASGQRRYPERLPGPRRCASPQSCCCRLKDLAVVGPLAHVAVQLRRQDGLLPAAAALGEPAADDRLGRALALAEAGDARGTEPVGVGGVEEVDAVLECGVHNRVRSASLVNGRSSSFPGTAGRRRGRTGQDGCTASSGIPFR